MNLSYADIGISAVLILIAIGISYFQKSGLEKEMSVASIRIFFQLLIMGYVLTYILKSNHVLIVLLVLIGMVFFGAYTVSSRERTIQHSLRISFISILVGVLLTIGIILLTGTIEVKSQYVIPVASMIISNSMNAASLAMNRLKGEIRAQKQQIEAALCLGASPKKAVENPLKATFKTSLIPSVNRAMTVGIVSLPGSMSGMIFAGISPIQAVKYQMLVEYVVIGSATITVFCTTFLTYREFFTEHDQLKEGVS